MSLNNNHSEFAISKYYIRVPIKEYLKLKEFRDSHPIKTIIYENNEIEYISSGAGKITTLILP